MKTIFLLLISIATSQLLVAQDRYRLVTPNSSADAVLTQDALIVTDATGQTTYLRDPRFDSPDRQWAAFYSRTAAQIIRWPVSNSGNMQIGLIQGGAVEYRYSQMSIQLDRTSNRLVLPPSMPNQPFQPGEQLGGQLGGQLGNSLGLQASGLFNSLLNSQQRGTSQMLRLATYNDRGSPMFLGRNGSLLTSFSAPNSGADWWVVPAGGQYVRVQHYENGLHSALSISGNSLRLSPLSQSAQQLWRVVPDGRGGDRFVLESAHNQGLCLANLASGQIGLQPVRYTSSQLWSPYSAPVVPSFQPYSRTVNQEVRPNPPLPPAQLGLLNNHRSALIVLLGDQRNGSVQQLRVEPGQLNTVTLDRDAGATLIETYETLSPTGIWQRQQFSTPIPPAQIYDLSIYEEFLQSIAIDRTGKSPNPIEDINYMPKSVGLILIPPGPQLPQNSTFDTYATAKAVNNLGAVRRFDPKSFERPANSGLTPAEVLLKEIQNVPRREF